MDTKTELARAKALIDAGKYIEARAIIVKVDHPKKDVWLKNIDAKIVEVAAVAPKPEKKAGRWTCWHTGAVIAGIVLIVFVALIIKVQQVSNEIFDGLSGEQVGARIILQVYCKQIEAPQENCESWADKAVRVSVYGVPICTDAYRTEYRGLTLCLLGDGVSVIPPDVSIEPVIARNWQDGDWNAIASLVQVLQGRWSEDYAIALAIVTYRDNREAVWGCYLDSQSAGDIVKFTKCLQDLGLVDI